MAAKISLETRLGQRADYVEEVFAAMDKIRSNYHSAAKAPYMKHLGQLKDGIKGLAYCLARREYPQVGDHPNPSFMIVLDWNSRDYYHDQHVSNGVSYSDEYVYEGQDFQGKELYRHLKRLMHTDAAVLVNGWKKIEKIRAQIITPKPEEMINELNLPVKSTISETLGYGRQVDTRHKSAHTGSYYMDGTVILTLSATTGDIRVYNQGRIIYSTAPEEVQGSVAKSNAPDAKKREIPALAAML